MTFQPCFGTNKLLLVPDLNDLAGVYLVIFKGILGQYQICKETELRKNPVLNRGTEAHEYLIRSNAQQRHNHSIQSNSRKHTLRKSRANENKQGTCTLGVIMCKGNNSASRNHDQKSRSSCGVSERFNISHHGHLTQIYLKHGEETDHQFWSWTG